MLKPQDAFLLPTPAKIKLIDELEEVFPLLSPKDKEFGESLKKQFRTKKDLSLNQWPWVVKLIQRAVVVPDATPAPAAQVGDFKGVIALFTKAQQHLKHPKIHLLLPDHSHIQLSIAGAKSKYPGHINITDGGGFYDGEWYGRIAPDGAWTPSNKVAAIEAALLTLMKELALHPYEVAMHYAKLTGHCCFCHRTLEADNSVGSGMGPVCAKNWGLYDQWKMGAANAGF